MDYSSIASSSTITVVRSRIMANLRNGTGSTTIIPLKTAFWFLLAKIPILHSGMLQEPRLNVASSSGRFSLHIMQEPVNWIELFLAIAALKKNIPTLKLTPPIPLVTIIQVAQLRLWVLCLIWCISI